MVLDEICDSIVRGETVKLSSFATFQVRSKNERIGRNPKTGEEVPILAAQEKERQIDCRCFGCAGLEMMPAKSLKMLHESSRRRYCMEKSPDAFRTISEVGRRSRPAAACAALLGNPLYQHKADEAQWRTDATTDRRMSI
jgi:hypothetical protein